MGLRLIREVPLRFMEEVVVPFGVVVCILYEGKVVSKGFLFDEKLDLICETIDLVIVFF